MPIKEKLSELEQRHEALHNEAREIFERCEKESRLPNKEEDARLIQLRGKDAGDGGEIHELRIQIQQARRLRAIELNGDDIQSGREPEQRKSRPLAHEDPVNTRNAKHRYSFLKACGDILNGGKLTGIEKEVNDDLTERSGSIPAIGGFKMPFHDQTLTFNDVEKQKKVDELRAAGKLLSFEEIDRRRREKRYTGLGSVEGAGSIPTILDTDWIELLRNATQVMAAGATEITDLRGKFAIPRQSGAGTGYWLAEGAAPTASNQTIDQVIFSPKTVGAYTDVTRRFFELSNVSNGEQFVKSDLTAVLGRMIDLAAINGSGTASQPLGILQNAGITSTRTVAIGTNGGAPTWAALVKMYTLIQQGNAATLGPFVYMSNGAVEGTLASTCKIGATFPVFLLENGQIYNKRFLVTEQVPSNLTKGTSSGVCSAMLGGVWSQLVLAYWSGVDILVDPYTGSSSGTVRIVALQDMDIQVRHNEAFSVCVDLTTT